MNSEQKKIKSAFLIVEAKGQRIITNADVRVSLTTNRQN